MNDNENDLNSIDWSEEVRYRASDAARGERLLIVRLFWWSASLVFGSSTGFVICTLSLGDFVNADSLVVLAVSLLGLVLGLILLIVGSTLNSLSR